MLRGIMHVFSYGLLRTR